MTVDNNLKNYFTWKHSTSIPVMTAAIIPFAVEAIHFGIKVCKDPHILKNFFQELKQKIHTQFCRQENETREVYRRKLLKNIAIITAAALITAGTVIFSFYTMPAALAITSAIVAILTMGKLYAMIRTLPEKIKKAKDFIIDTFKQRPAETIEEFKKRRLQGILRICLYTGLFAAAVGLTVLGGFVGKWISQATCHWEIHAALPFQNKVVVFLEYAALSIAHTVLAIRHLIKGNKAQAGFHFGAAAMGLAFPLGYLLAPGQEMRIHHSFLGLMLMLAPSRPVQIFGSFIAFDSALYFTGYNKSSYGYDYMNAVIDNLPTVVNSLALNTLLQAFVDRLKPSLKNLKEKEAASLRRIPLSET